MLLNYFKVAVRYMFRHKAFSAINILGLTLGITGALLLFIWIAHEFSFEQFHADKDRLYIGWNRSLENGQLGCSKTTPRVLAPTLKEQYASIEAAASYAMSHKALAGHGDGIDRARAPVDDLLGMAGAHDMSLPSAT